MKTIFDKKVVEELVNRINSLTQFRTAQWGKMTAYQMVKHCTLSEEMYLGKKRYDRLLIGRIFGSMSLRGILKDEQPMKKNQPTHATFKITGNGNLDIEKTKWINLLNEYSGFQNHQFSHPFFSAMSKEQIGNYVYKHTDHHLRQFNISIC
jgi:hypothetical protein